MLTHASDLALHLEPSLKCLIFLNQTIGLRDEQAIGLASPPGQGLQPCPQIQFLADMVPLRSF